LKVRHLFFTLSVLVIALVGCGRPCFYQAGTSIEQAERDLLQCIHEAEISVYAPDDMLGSLAHNARQEGFSGDLTCLCMEARGYVYLDANTLTPPIRQKKVISPINDYWIAEDFDAASQKSTASPEGEDQQTNPDLMRVIERWPELPIETKKIIVEMVR
jgi:hypothetical protein